MTGPSGDAANATSAIDDVQDLEDIALGENYELTATYVDMVIDAADKGDVERLLNLAGKKFFRRGVARGRGRDSLRLPRAHRRRSSFQSCGAPHDRNHPR